jgi:hypothetical protein
MRKLVNVIAAALCLGISGATLAQTPGAAPAKPAEPSADPRNFEGVWFKEARPDDTKARATTGDNIARPPLPPLNAKGMAMFNAREEGRKAGHPLPDPEVVCAPPGVPRLEFQPYPVQIIQTPGLMAMIHEDDRSNRLIYMDKKQPAHPAAMWLGHSVGHWEGNTLVVDTIAQRPESVLYYGFPMSAATHVVERFTKTDGGTKLVDDYTIDDPTLYEHPWTGRFELLWWPQTRVMEYICEEADHPEDDAAAAFHDK